MGLRTRLKSRVRTLLGRPQRAPAPKTAPAPAQPAPAQPAPAPAPVPARAAPPPSPAKPPAAPPAPSAKDDLKAKKAAHHFEKTRRGVLRFIDEQGGEAGLGEMHDHSERRYFVGHKRFSDLMEGLIEEALITYDHAEGRATLTDAGRTLAHTPMPPRPGKKK